MPGNLSPAVPQGVLPANLAAAFVEEVRFEAFINNGYFDGSSDRYSLVLNPRRFFRFTYKLTAAQYTTLWSFYQAHLVQAFYFYNPPETTPPFTNDPSGSQTVGRYVCVFDGSWSDAVMIGRSQGSFGLREVA